MAATPARRLVWNASASAPVGFYRVSAVARLRRGELVLAWPPRWAAQLASVRGYLPLGVPLIKHVAALNGDHVCAFGRVVSVDGAPRVMRLLHDRAGRGLPQWTGCLILKSNELLLANAGVPDSFDGRYFGISERSDVLGELEPLWVP